MRACLHTSPFALTGLELDSLAPLTNRQGEMGVEGEGGKKPPLPCAHFPCQRAFLVDHRLQETEDPK